MLLFSTNRMEWNLLIIIFFINDAIIIAFTIPRKIGAGEVGDSQERKWNMLNELMTEVDVVAHADLNSTTSTTITAIDSIPDEEEINWDFDITNILHNFLPALESNQGESNNNSLKTLINASEKVENLPEGKANMSTLLAGLLQNVMIDRNSIFRVQFFNSDFQRNSSKDNETSIVPNAIFGSPLCVGLCFTSQVYSDNGSVRILSDKRFSLFPPRVSSSTTEWSNANNFPLGEDDSSSMTQNSSSATTRDFGVLSWVPEWIYNNTISSLPIPRLPSLSSIPLQQYSLIPQRIIGVSSFVG